MDSKKMWSLQKDKRTETERNIFKPTGKLPKNNTFLYLIALAVVFLLVSFLMTYFSAKKLQACIEDFCFNSEDDLVYYTIFVFFNIAIVVLAIFGAYLIGKKLGNLIKK